MRRSSRLRSATGMLLVLSVALPSCGGAVPPDGDRAGRRAASADDLAPGVPLKLDMDAIFPPGAGRDLVLDNCTSCHSFVRIVLMQRTREQWAVVKSSMKPRVSGLSEADVNVIFDYLEASFNEARPEPKLPKWFVDDAAW